MDILNNKDVIDNDSILKKVRNGVMNLGPFETDKKTLTINDVLFDDGEYNPDDPEDYKKAILYNATIGKKARAKITLTDNETGKKSNSTIQLGIIPQITPFNSFVVKGKNYSEPLQPRLLAGAYPRETEVGSIEVFNNVGNRAPFRTEIDPKTKEVTFRIGQASIPALPILKTLNVKDNTIKNKIGDDLFESNSNYDYEKSINRTYRAIFHKKPETLEQAETEIREHFDGGETNPATNTITLGIPFENTNGDYLLETISKARKVLRGDERTENRDSLVFKSFHGVDDLLEESLGKLGRSYSFINKNKRLMNKADTPAKSIDAKSILKTIEQQFTASSISRLTRQTNPIAMLNGAYLTTLLGEGGISSIDSVPKASKLLQNSHMGFLDPSHSPESSSVGVTLSMALNTKKDKDVLKTKVIDVHTGKEKWISFRDLYDEPLAFAQEFKKKGNKYIPKSSSVHVIHRDKHETLPSKNVKYMIDSPTSMFDLSSNTIPFLDSNQGNRGMTSAKMTEQTIVLSNPEKPLVETSIDNKLLLDTIGEKFSFKATTAGLVTKVTDDYIEVSDGNNKFKHKIYNNIPLQDNSFLDSKVLVKEGDHIKKGQLIADSNFTKDGKYVYGVNLTTAYMQWKGHNFEDGLVITENAQDKLESSHIYKISVPKTDRNVMDLKKYKMYSPYKLSVSEMEKYDPDGTIRVGEKLTPNSIIAAKLTQNIRSGADDIIKRLRKSAVEPYKDDAVTWNKSMQGDVVNKIDGKNSVDIYVKTKEPFKVGDKLVGRHGNKGIVGLIIPNELAPITKSGNIIDIIMEPHGVPPRINPGQILENAAGKVADKIGKPIVIENFSNEDNQKYVSDLLKKYNVSEYDDIIDPETNMVIPQVEVGKSYITKLMHQVDKKISKRGIHGSYTMDETPTSGSGSGGQSIDRLTLNALLAYNPRDLLRESFSIKNNRNTDYWRAIINGEVPPKPQASHEYKKFDAFLKGMGVNLDDNGTRIKISPLTDKDIDRMSEGLIPNASKILRGRGYDITPEPEGLFGENTGGMAGQRFNHINLPSKIVSPAYFDAVKTLLHKKGTKIEDLL